MWHQVSLLNNNKLIYLLFGNQFSVTEVQFVNYSELYRTNIYLNEETNLI